MIIIKEVSSYIWFFKILILMFMIPADHTAKCFSWCEMWWSAFHIHQAVWSQQSKASAGVARVNPHCFQVVFVCAIGDILAEICEHVHHLHQGKLDAAPIALSPSALMDYRPIAIVPHSSQPSSAEMSVHSGTSSQFCGTFKYRSWNFYRTSDISQIKNRNKLIFLRATMDWTVKLWKNHLASILCLLSQPLMCMCVQRTALKPGRKHRLD